jgi:LacI family transcriptional regulator
VATIKDVATRAGVSVGTVSNLLNRSRFVEPATAARITSAMGALSYRPNALARSLRRRRTRTIGLILPNTVNPYFAEAAWHIQLAAASAGLGTMLCNSSDDPDNENASIELLLEQRVDGIILASAMRNSQHANHVVDADVPLVLFARRVPGVAADTLVTDGYTAGGLVADHFAQLGHRQVAYVGRELTISPSRDRFNGFRNRLRQLGIPLADRHLRVTEPSGQGGYRAARDLLQHCPEVTAIYAFIDVVAIGVVRALKDLGRDVPGSISVAGSDDIALAELQVPRLTTVRHSLAEVGRVAVEMIESRLANKKLAPRTHLLPVELIVRESTGVRPPTDRKRLRRPAESITTQAQRTSGHSRAGRRDAPDRNGVQVRSLVAPRRRGVRRGVYRNEE